MIADPTNSSLNDQVSLFSKPVELLDDNERAIMDEFRIRLNSNENTRLEIWTHFQPLLLFALFFYLMLSILWLFYNYRLYIRQKAKVQKERASRCAESDRRLEFYKQIPLEVTSDNEEIELVTNIKIVENGIEVHQEDD